jgi:regulator of protease activity HflC (stomatin/prohibitin superfamily)
MPEEGIRKVDQYNILSLEEIARLIRVAAGTGIRKVRLTGGEPLIRRNIVGDLELDETLTSRDIVNTKLRAILDEATDKWGIKVNRVELKNILPPQDIQNAMEKQMRAEREKREAILRAEGQKTATILDAEGRKQSAILSAEAVKEAAIREAEGLRQAQILKAQGEAEAILSVQRAFADSLVMIREAGADNKVLALKSLEALKAIGDGQSTKLIIPGDLAGLSGVLAALKEAVVDEKKPEQAQG